MIVYPNAKINIGLNILAKRPDGFHELSTLFCPVPGLSDVLEVLAMEHQRQAISFSQSGLPETCEPADNQCVRAYNLMATRCPLPPIAAHLHKQIPVGAGLGGGSSDGAFMLMALNQLVGSPFTNQQLMTLALELGSDCPFFVLNTPCLGRGRGEKLRQYPLKLQGYSILLVNPGIHIKTASAYAAVKPLPWPQDLDQLLEQPINRWANTLHNDFEKPIFAQYPEIERIKQQMYALGAIYASMSGSGSTVFGIFEEEKRLNGCFKGMYRHWAKM